MGEKGLGFEVNGMIGMIGMNGREMGWHLGFSRRAKSPAKESLTASPSGDVSVGNISPRCASMPSYNGQKGPTSRYLPLWAIGRSLVRTGQLSTIWMAGERVGVVKLDDATQDRGEWVMRWRLRQEGKASRDS